METVNIEPHQVAAPVQRRDERAASFTRYFRLVKLGSAKTAEATQK